MAEQQRREGEGGQGETLRPERSGDALGYAEAIIATVREPLVVLDGDLRLRSANRSFYNTFRVRPEDTEGRLLLGAANLSGSHSLTIRLRPCVDSSP